MINIERRKPKRCGKPLHHGFDLTIPARARPAFAKHDMRQAPIGQKQPPGGKPAPGRSPLTRLTVTAVARTDRNEPPRGRLRAGAFTLTCAIGGAGIRHAKREGDRATPAGGFTCLGGFFKAQSAPRPQTRLPLQPVKRELGWCDDPQASAYNRPLRLPSRFSHEEMWREDGLYDLVLVLDYNFTRRTKYRGSAIFLHCARPDFSPTQGCIALAPADWRRLLPRLSRRPVVVVR
jgi:L,D-peptidoglycan transpeptidase YkuD (ErfK/YbiS/YcfS/YnhG family)